MMSNTPEYDADEAELMAKGATTRDVTTGQTRSGVAEVVRLIDDGYRIYATWVTGGPISPEPGQCVVVAEYKHCDIPALAEVFRSALMKA